MKILFSLLFTFALTFASHAQIDFGLFAGPQASTAKYLITGSNQKTDYKFGFHLGGMMKVPFEGNLYFAPAAFYSMKGYKVTFNKQAFPPDTSAIDNNTIFHNFEFAALLQIDLGDNPSHFFIKAGPSLDFQLFGNEKYNRLNDPPVDQKMKFGFANYGHFSANFLAQFGFESSSGFTINGQYTLGLANISNVDGGPSIRHRVFGISIGKYFNRKNIIIDTRNIE